MVGQVDLSGISYFLPLLSFLVVMIIVFAVLQKIKIFENIWLQLFISFLLATIFVTFAGAREYVANIVPWVVVLVVCLFFILLFIGFIGKSMEGWNKGIGIAFVIIVLLGFLISALFVFSSAIGPYLPGGSSAGKNVLTSWAYSSRVAGGFLLLVISAIVSWVLVKAK
ncbi:MAG: hypothetical protein AABX07_06475 [Nanoarchaeota archaeon]